MQYVTLEVTSVAASLSWYSVPGSTWNVLGSAFEAEFQAFDIDGLLVRAATTPDQARLTSQHGHPQHAA